jgi:hypothetical protein
MNLESPHPMNDKKQATSVATLVMLALALVFMIAIAILLWCNWNATGLEGLGVIWSCLLLGGLTLAALIAAAEGD